MAQKLLAAFKVFRLIKDSSGQKSWTHTMAVPALAAITLWFIVGGLDLTIGSHHIVIATKSGSDYALAISPWLAFYAQREWNPANTGGTAAPSEPEGGK